MLLKNTGFTNEIRQNNIAVFDSGLGGLSVLRELIKVLPNEDYVYFGDSAKAPYGVKGINELRMICEKNTQMLLSNGAKCIVIACNTATAAAADYLREKFTDIPIIGIEPAVKPAALYKEHPSVLVMATPVTIKGDRLHRMIEKYSDKAEFHLLQSPDIVRFVEAGIYDGRENSELKAYLEDILSPYTYGSYKVDSVVLGCTHFPFVKNTIKSAFPYEIKMFDGAEGTARHTKQLLKSKAMLDEQDEGGDFEGSIRIMNSDSSKIELCKNIILGFADDIAD